MAKTTKPDLNLQVEELIKANNALTKERDNYKERFEKQSAESERLEILAKTLRRENDINFAKQQDAFHVEQMKLSNLCDEWKKRYQDKVLEVDEHLSLNRRLANENAKLLARNGVPERKASSDIMSEVDFNLNDARSDINKVVSNSVLSLKSMETAERIIVVKVITRTLNGIGIKSFDRSGNRLGI